MGTVSAVDADRRMVRVQYDNIGITSGWLYVLQHIGAEVVVAPDGGHTHGITDTYTGGGSAAGVPNHDHQGTRLALWLPGHGERVLAIHIPVMNGDGFILGGIY